MVMVIGYGSLNNQAGILPNCSQPPNQACIIPNCSKSLIPPFLGKIRIIQIPDASPALLTKT